MSLRAERAELIFVLGKAPPAAAAMEPFVALLKDPPNRRIGTTREELAGRDRDLDRENLPPAPPTGPARPIEPCRGRDHHDLASHSGCMIQPVT